MDIHKCGVDVGVLAPENLRNNARKQLLQAMRLYREWAGVYRLVSCTSN